MPGGQNQKNTGKENRSAFYQTKTEARKNPCCPEGRKGSCKTDKVLLSNTRHGNPENRGLLSWQGGRAGRSTRGTRGSAKTFHLAGGNI